jgi:hypothetical protein
VPDAAKNKANPVKSDAVSIATGKRCITNIANHVMVQKEKAMAQNLLN